MLNEIKDILEILAYVVAIIGGITGAIIYLQKMYKSQMADLDALFTGHLGNEGSIGDETMPSHYVELEITAKNGYIDGIVNTRSLTSESEWSGLSVSGKRKWNTAHLDVRHIRGGRIISVHKFTLTFKKIIFIGRKPLSKKMIFFQKQQFYSNMTTQALNNLKVA